MTRWHSLYLSSKAHQTIIDHINTYFEIHAYQAYDPFTAFPGMSYPITIKLFVVTLSPQWVRIIIDGDSPLDRLTPLIQHLSQTWDCLSVQLTGNVSSIHGYRAGDLVPLPIWASPHLNNPNTDIIRILNAESYDLPSLSTGKIGDIPLDGLPNDLQKMVKQIKPKDAQSLFNKLSKRVLKAVGKQDIRSLMNTPVDWDSQGGQSIRVLMQYLSIPDGWRLPDFATVRTAYTVHTHTPNGAGTFTNMFDYQPLYAGKQAD